MTTALEIIADALQNLGVYATNDPISAADATRSLTVLNDMIDQWNEEYIPIYALTNVTANLTLNQTAYLVGTGHPFNIQRPIAIQFGPQAASATINGVTTPVNVVSQVEFENLEGGGAGQGTPLYAFYDPQYPVGVLNISPAPLATLGTITIEAWVPASALTMITTSNVFASGAVRALKTNLAVRLQAYFLDGQISPALLIESVETKTALEYTNMTSRAMRRRYKMSRQPTASA